MKILTNDEREERITEARDALQLLRTLTAESLARPFIEWAKQLDDVHYAVEALLFPLGEDAEVRAGAAWVAEMLRDAADMIADSTLASLVHEDRFAAPGVRTWFETMAMGPTLRAELRGTEGQIEYLEAARANLQSGLLDDAFR